MRRRARRLRWGNAFPAAGTSALRRATRRLSTRTVFPQHGAVARVANVGLHHGGVQAQLPELLEPHLHRHAEQPPVDQAQRVDLQLHEAPLEGIVAVRCDVLQHDGQCGVGCGAPGFQAT